MHKLTSRQQQAYSYIVNYLQRHGFAPTLQELAAHLDIKGNLGVLRHLQALEKKGYIERAAGRSRGITLPGRSVVHRLPLLGTVAAGPLSEALQEADESIQVDVSLVHGDGCFVLRVAGDSMIGAQIADGDLAVVRPQSTAENGDIVVVMLNGEATLKRFYRQGRSIRLQPENSRLQPIILSAADGDLQLIGKVTGIMRVLEQ